MAYELYSLQDATYLIEYFSKKLTGKILEQSMQVLISGVDKESNGIDKFRVVATGSKNGNTYRKDISSVLTDLSMGTVDEVLSLRDQHP